MSESTPVARKVRLKRVEHLRRGDAIVPGLGLFTRAGTRIQSQAAMTDTWGREAWHVTDRPWMNAVPEMCVPVGGVREGHEGTTDILHTSLDAYVVLA